MDQKRVTLLVLLDLSVAFDAVDHEVLLRRMESGFVVSGTTLQWFGPYLEGRSQSTFINGSYSDSFDVRYGIPQGSCLGPLLLTIYVSKLYEVIKTYLPEAHAQMIHNFSEIQLVVFYQCCVLIG